MTAVGTYNWTPDAGIRNTALLGKKPIHFCRAGSSKEAFTDQLSFQGYVDESYYPCSCGSRGGDSAQLNPGPNWVLSLEQKRDKNVGQLRKVYLVWKIGGRRFYR